MAGQGHNSGAVAGNWIAVSRDMRDHPIVGMGQNVPPADPSRGSYSRYEAWQDLIMEAKFRSLDVANKGKIVRLERGQLMAARAWLAARWNWSEKTVRGFISRLESEFMVRSETGHRQGQPKGQQNRNMINVITICNYDIYQTIHELMEMEKGQQKGQDQGQPRASEGPEYNKETKDTDLERGRGDRVEVNCESLNLFFDGKTKRVLFSTIDLWAHNARMYDVERARKIVQGVMEGWVADGKMPDKPSDVLQRALTYRHIDDEVGQQRISNERKKSTSGPPKPAGRPRPWG